MKLSRYNTFFVTNGSHVGYNSLSDTFILMSDELYLLLVPFLEEKKSLELIKDIHPTLSTELVKKGFIVDDNLDELTTALKIAQKTDDDNNQYSIIVNPTMNCNFKCWYCYESHIVGSKMSTKTIDAIKAHISKVLQNKAIKRIHIGWFGGEPLLYYNSVMQPLLKYTKEISECKDVSFISNATTNGFLLTDSIIDNFKKYHLENLQITLDGNRERHNSVRNCKNLKLGTYDAIIQNIKKCAQKGVSVRVRINISNETLNGLKDIINDFAHFTNDEKRYICFSFHEVWQEKIYMYEQITSVIELFRVKGFQVLYKSEHSRSIFNTCYADKRNQVTINYNGDIFKCTARSFNSLNREGYLLDNGDIIWNEKYSKRFSFDLRTRNKACMECAIFPMCNGGCSQHRVENEKVPYCVFDFSESKKVDFLKDKFITRKNTIK